MFGFIKWEWKVIDFNNLLLVFDLLRLQNDLIHGWGLDMKLGYCAQVLEIRFTFLREYIIGCLSRHAISATMPSGKQYFGAGQFSRKTEMLIDTVT